MKFIRKSTKRGITLTELLVVLAIISLLATIAVPVYLSQIARAKVSTAQAEVKAIADAEQQVATLHGFFVPIHILDNIPNREDNVGGSINTRDDFDNLSSQTRYLIRTDIPLVDQDGANQLTLGTADIRVENLIETWQGPFLNPQRVYYIGQDVGSGATGDLTEDLPIDPWGNPYRVYTDFGLAGTAGLPNNTINNITIGFDNLRLTSGAVEQDRFDRFAIVSYGPDGVTGFTGDPLEQGDDIYYTFAGIFNETNYQGF